MTAGPDAAAAVAAEARRLAIPRVAEPEEITRMVLFVVDGGMFLGPAPQYERAETAAT